MTPNGWAFALAFAGATACVVALFVFAVRAFVRTRRADPATRAYGLTRGVFRTLAAVCCLIPFVDLVFRVVGP
jgi:hypothetical protein